VEVVICEHATRCDVPEASCAHKKPHTNIHNCAGTICGGIVVSCKPVQHATGTTVSQFENNAGALVLMTLENISYLEMQGTHEARWFGPLTANQVSAFKLLLDVPAAFNDESKDGEGCE